jgi:plastocyanin
MRAHRIVWPLIVIVAGAWPAVAGPLTGSVTVQARPGVQPAVAIVYAEPLDGAAPRQPKHATFTQKGRAFQPAVLAVPTGSTIDFPNQDLIFHNVFSLSPPEPFDLGLYRAGESKSRTFARAGLYRVFCNIHPEMTAVIAVVPTPYVAVADARGSYALEVPAGRYRVTAVSERSAPVFVEVTAGAAAVTVPPLTLDESQVAHTQHKNKFGQDYLTPVPTVYKKP